MFLVLGVVLQKTVVLSFSSIKKKKWQKHIKNIKLKMVKSDKIMKN